MGVRAESEKQCYLPLEQGANRITQAFAELQEASVPVLALPLTHWETLGKFLTPIPWFPSLNPEAPHSSPETSIHVRWGLLEELKRGQGQEG